MLLAVTHKRKRTRYVWARSKRSIFVIETRLQIFFFFFSVAVSEL